MRAITVGVFLLVGVLGLGGCAVYAPPRAYVEPTPYYATPYLYIVPPYGYSTPYYQRPRPHSYRHYRRW
jgi:hypothetical protein